MVEGVGRTAMNLPEENELLIRRYFLGDATEDEARRFEERVFTDGDFKTHALIVEDELFEDYAANLLPAEERAKFERHALRTAQSREKLSIISALQERQSPAPPPPLPTPSPIVQGWWRFGWLKFPRLSSAKSAAALATLALAVFAGGLWYAYRDDLPSSGRAQLKSEIDALNKHGLQPSAGRADLLSVKLTPGQLRGDGEQIGLVLPEGGLTVRFQLKVPAGQERPGLGVVLLNGKDEEVFSYDRPTVWVSDGQTEVVLDVPARALPLDDYLLKLRDTATRQDIAGGDYSFRVVRR
jgi:hypothetical protein